MWRLSSAGFLFLKYNRHMIHYIKQNWSAARTIKKRYFFVMQPFGYIGLWLWQRYGSYQLVGASFMMLSGGIFLVFFFYNKECLSQITYFISSRELHIRHSWVWIDHIKTPSSFHRNTTGRISPFLCGKFSSFISSQGG